MREYKTRQENIEALEAEVSGGGGHPSYWGSELGWCWWNRWEGCDEDEGSKGGVEWGQQLSVRVTCLPYSLHCRL